jgi:uncharacterized OB-fold protein
MVMVMQDVLDVVVRFGIRKMKYCPRCGVVYMNMKSLCEYCPEINGLPPQLKPVRSTTQRKKELEK